MEKRFHKEAVVWRAGGRGEGVRGCDEASCSAAWRMEMAVVVLSGSVARQDRLPEREDDEVFAEFCLRSFAKLANAFLGNAEFGGDHIERDIVQIIATQHVSMIWSE